MKHATWKLRVLKKVVLRIGLFPLFIEQDQGWQLNFWIEIIA